MLEIQRLLERRPRLGEPANRLERLLEVPLRLAVG
jgi:hypothetical protein